MQNLIKIFLGCSASVERYGRFHWTFWCQWNWVNCLSLSQIHRKLPRPGVSGSCIFCKFCSSQIKFLSTSSLAQMFSLKNNLYTMSRSPQVQFIKNFFWLLVLLMRYLRKLLNPDHKDFNFLFEQKFYNFSSYM